MGGALNYAVLHKRGGYISPFPPSSNWYTLSPRRKIRETWTWQDMDYTSYYVFYICVFYPFVRASCSVGFPPLLNKSVATKEEQRPMNNEKGNPSIRPTITNKVGGTPRAERRLVCDGGRWGLLGQITPTRFFNSEISRRHRPATMIRRNVVIRANGNCRNISRRAYISYTEKSKKMANPVRVNIPIVI